MYSAWKTNKKTVPLANPGGSVARQQPRAELETMHRIQGYGWCRLSCLWHLDMDGGERAAPWALPEIMRVHYLTPETNLYSVFGIRHFIQYHHTCITLSQTFDSYLRVCVLNTERIGREMSRRSCSASGNWTGRSRFATGR